MVWNRLFATIILGGSLSSCYVETIDGERENSSARRIKQDGRQEATPMDAEAGQCRVTALKGCFDGHVIAKKEFLVEGKTFFNADDLATRFSELITVEQLGGDPVNPAKFRIELLTAMDNPSFLHGFEYYLSGGTVRSGTIRNNGVFNISELAEGSYELRLQKAIQFAVHQVEEQVPESTPNPSPAPTPGLAETPAESAALALADQQGATSAKVYCATLYADKTIDIRRGQRLWEPFNEFRLHVIDRECPQAGSGRVITL